MSKKDEEDALRYDRMVEGALRGVVREALQEVVDTGLPGDHHFYITFMTDHPGVSIPSYLKDRYPGEMTIVLQYQFYDLAVTKEILNVTLSFNNVPEKLVIPIPAITIFADPSVNFALQFQPLNDSAMEDDIDDADDDDPISPDDKPKKGRKKKTDGDAKSGEVISLDQFRKK
ncbi:MAG: hypothetical protein GC136_08185 [Alphaproteobacteria bacterium]|nr:hypothetical protein [Alphaproteobacteria bacterium]